MSNAYQLHLKEVVDNHIQRIEKLRGRIVSLNREIQIHERFIELVGHETVRNFLTSVQSIQSRLNPTSDNLASFAQKLGIAPPENVDGHIEIHPSHVEILGRLNDDQLRAEFRWDSRHGFDGRITNLSSGAL